MARRSLLLLLLLWGVGTALGQVLPPPDIEVDTTATDSLAIDYQEEINPRTERIFPDLLFAHRPARRHVDIDMGRLIYFDPLDSLPGFRQTLGQPGKPARVYRWGLPDYQRTMSVYRDPFFRRHNPNFVDVAREISAYDTRTQYLPLNYVQGGRGLQYIDGELSRNIGPALNITGWYRNRQATGAYPDMTSNQRIVSLQTYFRTDNRRYHAFFAGAYQEATEGINGGTTVVTGDSLSDFFAKTSARTILGSSNARSQPETKTISRSLRLDQILHLAGKTELDSTQARLPQRLSLRFTAAIEAYYHRYEVSSVSASLVRAQGVPVLPSFDFDAGETDISEEYRATATRLRGGASYSLGQPGGFHLNAQGGLLFNRTRFRDFQAARTDVRSGPWVRGNLDLPDLGAHLRVEGMQTISSLFPGETRAQADFRFQPRLRYPTVDFADTLVVSDDFFTPGGLPTDSIVVEPISTLESGRPLRLEAQLSYQERNPSYFQRWFAGKPANTFRGDSTLGNESVLSARIGLRYSGDRRVAGGDTTEPNFVSLTGFFSQVGEMIYYSADYFGQPFRVRQAAPGQTVSWSGLELAGRLRFLKKMYVDGRVVAQNGQTTATNDLLLYAQNQPKFYGNLRLYYENKNLTFAARLRLGVEVSAFTSYRAATFDPLSGEFFPTAYRLPGNYPRVDLFAVTQIRRTFIWLRLVHANEGFPQPGYFTTPFYPEYERTFLFGVQWTFFD